MFGNKLDNILGSFLKLHDKLDAYVGELNTDISYIQQDLINKSNIRDRASAVLTNVKSLLNL